MARCKSRIAMREVRMLKQLRHENLVNLIEVFRRKKRLYLVFEFVDHTILDELERYPSGLDEQTVRKCLWQVLKGIEFCHVHNIIHRDIKPENILVSKSGIVKLCDFGFARTIAGPGEIYTDYVATRWYRAPELLVGDTNYGKAVDVWAVGCLQAEMLTGEPLFPGDSDIDQLYHIIKCFGNLIQRHKEVFMKNPLFVGMRLPEVRNVEPLERRFPHLTALSITVMKSCLHLDPDQRPSCDQILRHEFFTKDGFYDTFPGELRDKIRKEVEENPLLRILYGDDKGEDDRRRSKKSKKESSHDKSEREKERSRRKHSKEAEKQRRLEQQQQQQHHHQQQQQQQVENNEKHHTQRKVRWKKPIKGEGGSYWWYGIYNSDSRPQGQGFFSEYTTYQQHPCEQSGIVLQSTGHNGTHNHVSPQMSSSQQQTTINLTMGNITSNRGNYTPASYAGPPGLKPNEKMKKTGSNSFFKKTSKASDKTSSPKKTTQFDKLTSGQWRRGSKEEGPSPKLEREVTHLPNLTDSKSSEKQDRKPKKKSQHTTMPQIANLELAHSSMSNHMLSTTSEDKIHNLPAV
ncbi:putative cyclin-dependent kinase-like 2 [Apostichopus japonicus]|uniref:Putative cyclin-dependent kinase-like 2 n=1 Tax=Stichopus japonicus TaxID=307972 RepID=A0A2G8KJY1_STIJA|nr:putative cyclin-dependent kinase-like 2 [Apostichopus japonicus]